MRLQALLAFIVVGINFIKLLFISVLHVENSHGNQCRAKRNPPSTELLTGSSVIFRSGAAVSNIQSIVVEADRPLPSRFGGIVHEHIGVIAVDGPQEGDLHLSSSLDVNGIEGVLSGRLWCRVKVSINRQVGGIAIELQIEDGVRV